MESNILKWKGRERIITGIIFTIIIIYNIIEGGILFDALLIIILIAAIFEMTNIIKKNKELDKKNFTTLVGYFYICLSLLSLKLIRNSNNGHCYTILLYLSLWLFDSLAYIFGKLVKGKKIFTRISPKKTWSGFIIGMFITIVIYNVFFNAFFQKICILRMNNISIVYLTVTLIIGLIGDLGESRFKRIYKVKDSSKILNGHGGILDRLDSISLTAIFLYCYLKIQHNFY